MPIQIGQLPSHGFDEPLGLLSDCHRRIERFLGILVTVANRTPDGTGRLSASERDALQTSLKYFATAAPAHTADEEESLFPRLRASAAPEAAAALERVTRLERDHDEAERHHAAVDRLVRRWLDADQLEAAEARSLRTHLAALRALYDAHIEVEDRDVFPAAARVLSADQLALIGREMAARRGLAISAFRLHTFS